MIAEDEKTTQSIVIPYRQRDHFKPLHASKKRFKFVVAHRRAGKSVAEINELIKQALTNPRVYPPPRYAYIGPTFAQTKDLIWGYAKHYTSVFGDQVKYSESDLQLTLPNGAMVNLYGGAGAYERMRGLYFDGAVADEFALLHPDMFGTVVRPCLSDYKGWFIASGTSNGDDHFHELKIRAEKDPDNWDVFVIPVTETDALDPEEVKEMTKDMTPEQYAREMLCSFAAPIEGAYYGDILNDLEAKGRVTGVPYDPSAPVYTWWDLGIDDAMAIWYIQRVGREIHVIDYDEFTGMGFLDDLTGRPGVFTNVKAKPYTYAFHIPPHDIKARELGSGRQRLELMQEHLKDVFVSPMAKVEDGISAVRSVLPMCWFDKEKTAKGRLALRNYHHGVNGKPVHNWASHGSDAFRTGSNALNLIVGHSGSNIVSLGGRLRRRLSGLTR